MALAAEVEEEEVVVEVVVVVVVVVEEEDGRVGSVIQEDRTRVACCLRTRCVESELGLGLGL